MVFVWLLSEVACSVAKFCWVFIHPSKPPPYCHLEFYWVTGKSRLVRLCSCVCMYTCITIQVCLCVCALFNARLCVYPFSLYRNKLYTKPLLYGREILAFQSLDICDKLQLRLRTMMLNVKLIHHCAMMSRLDMFMFMCPCPQNVGCCAVGGD